MSQLVVTYTKVLIIFTDVLNLTPHSSSVSLSFISCKRLAWVAGIGQIIINGSALCQSVGSSHVEQANFIYSPYELAG